MGQDRCCMTPNTVAVEHKLFFNECHVISTVLQLFELIQFLLKNAICMFVIFPKFCFKQNISVAFFFFVLMHLRRHYDSLFAKFDTIIMC